MKKPLTVENVKDWLGSDATIEDCIVIIGQVANGIYKPDVLRSDIDNINQ